MQAVVLAAGRGTRLRPVTEGRSKAMVPVVGKPLVEWALAPVVACGIHDIVMVVGPDDKEIRDYFSNRSKLGVSVQWVIQEDRLGMAHALLQAGHLLHGPFILTACDSLVSAAHFRELVAAARGADAVLSLLDVDPTLVSRSAAVRLDGELVLQIVEKPVPREAPSNTVSLPHYVFTPQLVGLLSRVSRSPRGEFELQDAIQHQIDEGARVIGVRSPDRVQVSTPDDLLALSRQKLAEGFDLGGRPRAFAEPTLRTIDPVFIENGATIGVGCTIGPEVYLESGCVIGDGAEIRRSIVLRGARVPPGQHVADAVVVGRSSEPVKREDSR